VILTGAAMPLLAAALLAITARRTVRRLPPATAVLLLTATSLAIAAATCFVLGTVAVTVAGTDAEVAALGHWSAPVVERLSEVPTPIGIAAGAAVVVLTVAAARHLIRAMRTLWAADAACRRLGAGVDGLVILDDDHPDAYALPGVSGRIVVSRGMLAALTPAERRVLLAHERSHLVHRHSLLVQLAGLAAAANPLLRPVATAVREGVERWADEDAAAAVGDRRLTARALARAAAATGVARRDQPPAALAALAMSGSGVAVRACALLAPPPRPRRMLTAGIVVCALAACAGATVVACRADHAFDSAGMVVSTR